MANFFFFTDYDLYDTAGQNASDIFGKVSPTQFNFYSKHIGSQANASHPQFSFLDKRPNAYAVCTGTVLVFGTTSSNTVDIVLKPQEQPKNGLPAIKYFIYHRVVSNSFFDPANTPNKIIEDKNVTEALTNNLRVRVNNSRKVTDVNRVNTSKIGVGKQLSGFTASDSIDKLFLKNSATDAQYTVEGGFSLGKFSDDANGFGLSIVFDSLVYNPDISLLQNANLQPTFLTPPGGASNDVIAQIELINREIKGCFIDPCAFFGSFSKIGLRARKFSDTFNPNADSGYTSLPGTPIFQLFDNGNTNNLYATVLDKYNNKNKVYVDIRNPENNSLNYSNNYNNNIRIKATPSTTLQTFQPLNYYRDNIPFLVLTPSDFNNSSTGSKGVNVIEVGLPDGITEQISLTVTESINNAPQTTVTQTFNIINNPNPSVFSDNMALKSELKFAFDKELKRNDAATGFTTPIKINLPNYSNQGDKPISTYIRLNYLKENDIRPDWQSSPVVTKKFHEVPSPDSRSLFSYEYLDNLFTPFRLKLPQAPNAIGINNTFGKVFSYLSDELINIDNCRYGSTGPFIGKLGIAEDKNSGGDITLFGLASELKYKRNAGEEPKFAFEGAADSKSEDYFLQLLQKKFPAKIVFRRMKFVAVDIGETNDIELSVLEEKKKVDTNGPKPLDAADLCNLVWITIKKNIWNQLQAINFSTTTQPTSLVSTDPNYAVDPYNGNISFKANFIDPSRTFLGLKIVKTGWSDFTILDKSEEYTRDLNSSFIKYELYLTGEYDSGLGVKLKSIRTGLFTFSIRPFPQNFSSKFNNYKGKLGYEIENISALVKRIKSKILLMRYSDVSEEEFFDFKEYFLGNIRQVWNNDNVTPRNSSYINKGILGGFTIDADQIEIISGNFEKYYNLKNSDPSNSVLPEVAFIVRKPTSKDGERSAVYTTQFGADIQRRNGIMFYQKASLVNGNPPTRYAESIDGVDSNIPAHEFGHMMKLSDGYTYVIKTNNNLVDKDDVRNRTSYMQKETSTVPQVFDTERVTDFNWCFNLYTDQFGVFFGAAALGSYPVYGTEAIFISTFNAGTKQPVPVVVIGPETPDNPIRYKEIYVSITSKQIGTVLNTLSNDSEEDQAESSVLQHIKYFFKNKKYVFIKNNSAFGGRFLGLHFNTFTLPGDFPDTASASDDTYTPQNNANDKIMENRIRNGSNIISVFMGHFSPYLSVNWSTSIIKTDASFTINHNVENLGREYENIVTGGLNDLKDAIDEALDVKTTTIQDVKDKFHWNETLKAFQISGVNANFRDIGDSDKDGIGRIIWNTTNLPSKRIVYKKYTIYYSDSINRRRIILAIKNGTL